MNITVWKTTRLNFVVAHKELCLAVNAEKFKFVVMSQDQPAVQNHNIKIGGKPFERMG